MFKRQKRTTMDSIVVPAIAERDSSLKASFTLSPTMVSGNTQRVERAFCSLPPSLMSLFIHFANSQLTVYVIQPTRCIASE